MNPIGIYYAYWTRNWDADFVPLIGKVKDLGFDILEVNAGTVTRMAGPERERLKQAADDAGIELTYCIGLTHDLDVASENDAVRARGVEFLKDMARAVAGMGHKTIGGIIYGSWPGKLAPGVDKRAAVDRSVSSMREAVKVAEDVGVYFNVEVVNRFEQYVMNTAAEAVEYVGRVGSDYCRILLDTFHLNIEEDSIHDAIVTAGARLGHFHIGENNRRAPGRGRIPWQEVCGALKEIHYQGAISMEPFIVPGGEVGRDISVYRDLQDGLDLDQEAARALQFIRQQLA